MCGFAGFCDMLERNNINSDSVRNMADLINHRGTDNRGYYIDPFFSIGFCRLSIVDPEKGNQPFISSDGRYILSFNGEIYNFRELRTRLKENFGIKFKTSSDTEVLLYMCIYYGKDALTMLKGMFSFIFYDKHEKYLFGARDPFGIKPFYYGIFDNYLLFASEIKAFLGHPAFKKEFNKDILPYYLQYQYVPTEECAFKNVYRLKPGHMLTYDGNNLEITKYFIPSVSYTKNYRPYGFFKTPKQVIKKKASLKKSVNTAINIIEKSVYYETQSDVPIGAFLSGGVDSSLICAIAKPERLYNIGFEEDMYDESKYAKETADSLEIPLVSNVLRKEDFFKYLPEVEYHSDEPYANLSAVPLYLIAMRAHKNIKVLLSGEGADELFGGYDLYRKGRKVRLFSKLPKKYRKYVISHDSKINRKLKNIAKLSLLTPEEDFIGQAKIMDIEDINDILNDKYKNRNILNLTSPFYNEYINSSEIRKKMQLDFNMWMPMDILNKADKMTMAHSVELRVPYLDLSIYALTQTFSDNLLVKGNMSKRVLRKAALKYLPKNTAYRRKKGFPVPFKEWIREDEYYNIIKNAFNSNSAKEFFNINSILNILDEHKNGTKDNGRIIYTIYAFLVWYDRYFSFSKDYIIDKENNIIKLENKPSKVLNEYTPKGTLANE